MTETTVSPDLLQPLEIVTELRVDTVGEGLRVLAVDDVLLPVKEPGGDLVLGGVLLENGRLLAAVEEGFARVRDGGHSRGW